MVVMVQAWFSHLPWYKHMAVLRLNHGCTMVQLQQLYHYHGSHNSHTSDIVRSQEVKKNNDNI